MSVCPCSTPTRSWPGPLCASPQAFPCRPPLSAVLRSSRKSAFGLYELPQHDEVPMGILLVPKRGGEDVAGGIVNGREERQARAPLLQPIMVAAVELHEQAGSGHALPAPTVSGRAAAAGGPGAPPAG